MLRWYEGFESSTIKRFGYNSRAKLLVVEFKKGGVYMYYDAPPKLRRGLRETKSKGKYFHKKVRPLPYRRIR